MSATAPSSKIAPAPPPSFTPIKPSSSPPIQSSVPPPVTTTHPAPPPPPPTPSHSPPPPSPPAVSPPPPPPVSSATPPSPSTPPPSSQAPPSNNNPPSNNGPSNNPVFNNPPANNPGNGGQPVSPNDGNTAAPPGNNAIPQSSETTNWSFGSTPSTWVTVLSPTPTTMSLATMTTVDGSAFDTTIAVTTFFGGRTETISSNEANSTGSITKIPTHSTNNVGPIVGSIAGAIVVVIYTLFMCKVLHKRRTVKNQERQMADSWLTESWLTRPFSRAATRRRYRDLEVAPAVPAIHGRRESDQAPLHEQANESFTSWPLTPMAPVQPVQPVSLPALESPISDLKPRKSTKKKKKKSNGVVDVRSISGPVGPVMVEGDSTALRSALESGDASSQAYDPSSQPSSDAIPDVLHNRSPQNSSVPIETENTMDEHDYNTSLAYAATTDTIVFHNPESDASSLSEYHLPTDRYVLDPFSDTMSPIGTSSEGSTLMDPSRLSGESTITTLSSSKNRRQGTFLDMKSFDGDVRSAWGPNLTALMNEARK